MERSKNGVARPVFYKGEQVGEWRHYDERLTMFLLRFRRRHRFGPRRTSCRARLRIFRASTRTSDIPFDPEGELDGCLDALEFAPDPPPEDGDAMDRGRPDPGPAVTRAYARARAHMSLPTLATSSPTSRARIRGLRSKGPRDGCTNDVRLRFLDAARIRCRCSFPSCSPRTNRIRHFS